VLVEIETRQPLNLVESIGDRLVMQAQTPRCRVLRAILSEIGAQRFHHGVALRGLLAQQAFQFLCDETLKSSAASFGIDFAGGFSPTLARDLHSYGFRRFAASPGRRDELRLILSQAVKE
jgi:hypothetical protein